MRKLSWALLISLGMHLCIWHIASQWRPPQRPPARRSVVLSVRTPAPRAEAPKPPPETNTPQRPGPPSTRWLLPSTAAAPQPKPQRPPPKLSRKDPATATPSIQLAAPSPAGGSEMTGQAPRRIDLYAGAWRNQGSGATSEQAGQPSAGPTADDTAQTRLHGWTQAARNHGHATAPLPKAITQLRENMVKAFSPHPADLRLAPNAQRRHKPVDPDILWRVERARQATTAPPEARKQVELELATVVTLEHDAQGRAIHPRLLVPSGVDAFDRHVLQVVAKAIETGQWRGPPGVQHTRWEFTGKLLRWSRAELLLEPTFQPPGREIEAEKTLRYRTTVVGEVHLLEMAVGT